VRLILISKYKPNQAKSRYGTVPTSLLLGRSSLLGRPKMSNDGAFEGKTMLGLLESWLNDGSFHILIQLAAKLNHSVDLKRRGRKVNWSHRNAGHAQACANGLRRYCFP
jgi:hypothetical protein